MAKQQNTTNNDEVIGDNPEKPRPERPGEDTPVDPTPEPEPETETETTTRKTVSKRQARNSKIETVADDPNSDVVSVEFVSLDQEGNKVKRVREVGRSLAETQLALPEKRKEGENGKVRNPAWVGAKLV